MTDDREFNRVPMIHVDSVSQQLRRRRGKRKRVPWRRRDLVFAVLAVPVFTALAVAAFEAARHGPRSAILASVLGALIGAPAGVLFGGVALVAFLVACTGLFGGLIAEAISELDRKSRLALFLLIALTLEWLGSGIGGSTGLIINPGLAFAELGSPLKTGLAWFAGAGGWAFVWLWRRLQLSLFGDWPEQGFGPGNGHRG